MVAAASGATISGELKQWHKVTLDFTGPSTSEAATPNPFTDYRLDVTFHNGDRKFVVPGYYAADGNAAETGAAAGSAWRALFAPDKAGKWTYSARFTTGKDVATGASGKSAGFFDGATGAFSVATSDKQAPDLRSMGRLDYVGKHHLRFAGTGEYFLKCGADAPENFLAYTEFDGDFKSDGRKDNLVKRWEPHVKDWRPGDPTWQNGKGKGIIGAINYLASQGMNAFSFLTLNIEGDDRNVFPYTTYDERERLDCSRLDQWGIVFEHGTQMGMFLHFKTLETENELLLDQGNLGPQRTLYYRELIARFSHNLALNWNLGEEINNASTAQKASWANYIWNQDPYHHSIVIHNGANHYDLLGEASVLTGFSLQTSRADFSQVHGSTLNYLRRSAKAGRPWVVACDEPGDASHALITDAEDPAHDNARKNALWGNIMAGGAGVEWYFGYQHPHSDLTCEDYRTRERMWQQSYYALAFFREHQIPFWEMQNNNALVSDENAYCLFLKDKLYLVYLKHGGPTTLDLSDAEGALEVLWYNPRAGGHLQVGSIQWLAAGGKASLGRPPGAEGQDWLALVRPADPNRNYPPAVDAGPNQTVMLPRTGETITVNLLGMATDDGKPGQQVTSKWAKQSGPGRVRFENARSASTAATFRGAGVYVLKLTADDGTLQGNDSVTVTVEPFSVRVTKTFTPIADAYLEGGKVQNNDYLKVEGARRVAYLKFDVEGLPSQVLAATLELTAKGDSGSGTLQVLRGSHSEWTEKMLSRSTAPAPGDEVGRHTGGVNEGQTIAIPVTPLVTSNGTTTVILMLAQGGNDIWFASSASAVKPRLTVVAEDPQAR